jgi:hypothetical protein
LDICIASFRSRLSSVELGGQRGERSAREDRLDRQAEDIADPKREIETWEVIASFQSAHGLRIDVDQRRELCSRHPPLAVNCDFGA